ncbi:MAG: D-alanyl-D-alanine carboxypeptidase/D-alanyl-D-alanine-endopeptidase [Verrucomicrobia bacterium]|jgi:D-alanyl-D-alanine carboxypeptidase/D-alanyl-D-alanine-endopeptidase (penicillin-binding protein 4)|nr:D-alanyl-D-alanine carboxypeptidase/D-alanyl-D-alanine-endopeptidase [Verrucomicrobiota bacterium]
MTLRLPLLALLTALAACPPPAFPGPASTPATHSALAQWRLRVENHIRHPRFQHAQWGIQVVSLQSGVILFEHHAHQLLQPASNAKLFTAALALHQWGPDGRIPTPVLGSMWPDANGVIHGDVCIEGRGDPTFTAETHGGNLDLALQPLVTVLTQAGIRRIEGDLVGDDRFLASLGYGTGWMWEDLEYGYGSPISALSFDDNSLALCLAPASEPGAPCQVTMPFLLRPLVVLNRTITTRDRPREALSARRRLGTDQVILAGELPMEAQAETLRVPVDAPALRFMENLESSLRRQGIQVEGRTRVGSSLTATCLLGQAESPPVKTILRRMLKDSHNLTASLLFAHTGRRAQPAWEGHPEAAGSLALNQFLHDAGLPAVEVQIEEGSGLSRNNLASPQAVVALLSFMRQHAAATNFIESLPVAGVDGTLKERFVGTRVQGNLRAKTGTLRWAQALSGYVTSDAGEPLAFSILLNRYQPAGSDPGATEEVDALALMLCEIPAQTNDP